MELWTKYKSLPHSTSSDNKNSCSTIFVCKILKRTSLFRFTYSLLTCNTVGIIINTQNSWVINYLVWGTLWRIHPGDRRVIEPLHHHGVLFTIFLQLFIFLKILMSEAYPDKVQGYDLPRALLIYGNFS